jgi:hypothetical protein
VPAGLPHSPAKGIFLDKLQKDRVDKFGLIFPLFHIIIKIVTIISGETDIAPSTLFLN